MKAKNPVIIVGAAIAVIIVAALAWYLASPLFIDDVVDEALPTFAEFEAMSDEELDAMTDAEKDEMREVVEATAAAMPSTEMDEEMPESAGPTTIASGQFESKGGIYQSSGEALLIELSAEEFLLRFEDFEVTNGPDLHVLLSPNANPTGRDDLGDYIDLGELKGNVGNQNYEISADIDLSLYKSIVIYCEPFHVLFASASLGG